MLIYFDALKIYTEQFRGISSALGGVKEPGLCGLDMHIASEASKHCMTLISKSAKHGTTRSSKAAKHGTTRGSQSAKHGAKRSSKLSNTSQPRAVSLQVPQFDIISMKNTGDEP